MEPGGGAGLSEQGQVGPASRTGLVWEAVRVT